MTDDFMETLREAAQQRRLSEREAVAQARATCGKEPFDIQKLNALYDLTWDIHDMPLTPSLIEDYERRYYLGAPGIKTLRQFADFLVVLRDNDAN